MQPGYIPETLTLRSTEEQKKRIEDFSTCCAKVHPIFLVILRPIILREIAELENEPNENDDWFIEKCARLCSSLPNATPIDTSLLIKGWQEISLRPTDYTEYVDGRVRDCVYRVVSCILDGIRHNRSKSHIESVFNEKVARYNILVPTIGEIFEKAYGICANTLSGRYL